MRPQKTVDDHRRLQERETTGDQRRADEKGNIKTG